MKCVNYALGCFLLSLAGLVQAQEAPEFPGPQAEHEWLQKFVGTWKTESSGAMGEGQPETKMEGTITSRMLDGFWVISEMEADVMGAKMTAIQTIGYDATKKAYVGSWVDSMTSHMWVYEGSVDESGKKLTLEAEGPNFMAAGELTKFRDAYEFESPDHIIVTSSMLGADGEWMTFMTGDARRVE